MLCCRGRACPALQIKSAARLKGCCSKAEGRTCPTPTAGVTIEGCIREKIRINTDFIKLESGISRINIKIKAGVETEINCQGPHISEGELERLFSKIDRISDGDTIVIAGNIPNTMPDDVYERILERIKGKDVRIVVDATKKLLLNALKYKPFLIKPNRQELSEMFGVEINTEDDIEKYAKETVTEQCSLTNLEKDTKQESSKKR